jgi:hypothetical protein
MLSLLATLTGCATNMPLSPDRPVNVSANDSIAIFTMRIRNDFKNYLLTPQLIYVESVGGSGGKSYRVSFNDPEQRISDREIAMVGSLSLPPGDYEITRFTGMTDVGFALLPVRGSFEPRLERRFRIEAGESVYLGHIFARLVARESDDEPRAGPVIPLIDQAATGMSTGTFKIEVVDRFEEDVRYIKSRFPSVAGRTFTNRLLTGSNAAKALDRNGAGDTSPVSAVTSDANDGDISAPLVLSPEKTVNRKALTETAACTTNQVLSMKKSGLSDAQVQAACR